MWKFLGAVAVVALAAAIYPQAKKDNEPPNGWFELPPKGEPGCHALTGDGTPAHLYALALSVDKTPPKIIDKGDEVDVETDYKEPGERVFVRYFRTREACAAVNDALATFEKQRADDLDKYLAKYR